MKKKIDFEQHVEGYVKCGDLYYKILKPIIHNGETVGAKTHLVCPASHSNAWTDYGHCGFFIRECDLYYYDIYDNMSVVTKDEVAQYIEKITKTVIENFL